MTPKTFPRFLSSDRVFSPAEIDEVIALVKPDLLLSWTNKRHTYYNIPCAFDCEASSFYDGDSKVGIMYVWTLGIDGLVVMGRTWAEYVDVMHRLVEGLHVGRTVRLLVYVHNLGYDFQFFRKWFHWTKVFAISPRTPLYALSTDGVEYRCSYLLSGYGLAKLGDELRTFKVSKLVGDLDYSLVRHSGTELTPEEIGYCVNDVKVVMAYIAERMESDGDLARLPLTKTGYVRTYCRNACFYEDGVPQDESRKREKYLRRIRGMRLDEDEYRQLKRAFQGGFVHANPFTAGEVVADTDHMDFTSSYPATLVAEMFPMGSGELYGLKSKEDLDRQLRLYCCLFDIEFFDLTSTLFHDSYISVSRCREVENAQLNNGRVVRADHLKTTVTEQDFMIIRTFYHWKKARIRNFRRYKKSYLPTDFVKAVLQLYHDKTTLKGVEGKEIEYARSKEMLNSCFGMCVTDIVRDEIVYQRDEWGIRAADAETELKRYNYNPGRFLFYPWGVWVTAYARRNLFSAILVCGPDYVYSDTDSVVLQHAEQHRIYFENYNRLIRQQLLRACEYHKIDAAAIEPETADGFKKLLGAWDFEGHYARFKTIGAKRYLVQYSDDPRNPKKKRGQISLTVSGINKHTAVPWLLDRFGPDGIFDAFDDDLYVDPDFSGKKTHTYLDKERRGVVKDYRGVEGEYHELSAVHMENSEYSLTLAQEYADYVADLAGEIKMKGRGHETEVLQLALNII